MNTSEPRWRTATRSNGTGACVEVADNLPGRVLVRDSKDRSGAVLMFEPEAWQGFVEFVKSHR
ncbi:DUF397 domain-containing protein [Micromonospora sp. HM5-17]|jgi:hypothetical protein|uniref:DUF397 domain-containing protein n=1 Tax=Micromonospora sp. HM5-17 TaxID=2487710 RepID=UPI000F47D8A2|nr:DUF397 domain-containing protein [Micromonospora sp. HM5-17]ROT31370.1 DUF397 domain-containing protein [Micromonospora sp. HM5-17]